MKRAIYFNQTFNQSNPPNYAVCLTYDDVNGLQIVNNKKTISISTSTDVAQNQEIKALIDRITTLEQESTSFDKDESLSNTCQLKDDYTAFEVMPTKVVIPAGTIDEITELKYNSDIPVSTIHKILIRTSNILENCDVVVDWGDGTYETINDGNHTSSNGYDYELVHDYASVMTKETQRFIIKIYGKDYWCFRSKAAYTGANLISRIFDKDLPVAHHLANFNGTCYGADRLLKVHFYNYYQRIQDIGNCFSKCKNLVKATGFGTIINDDNGSGQALFENCIALEETDFRFPAGVSELSTTFNGCSKLSADINNLLPKNGFEKKHITIGGTFGNCKSITGDSFDKKLWNDGSIRWTIKPAGGMAGPFSGSSLELLAPKSWGGTASDDIIEKSFEEKYNELLEKINSIEENLKQNNN